MEPWINPPQLQEIIAKNGKKLNVVFEEDTLEIFYMGEYFKTCLSPSACNFFSVIANAADINKHVIYARDARGRVVGRCLIALGTEGELLTFYPYSHDNSLRFDEIIGELAEDLARRMKTYVAKSGNIPVLVASDWYDDGPQDLCNRFAFLNYDSDFRLSLENIALEGLIPALKNLFKPLPLNSLTLPLVIELSEFQTRPELILPLLPEIETCQNIPDAILLKAAMLAYRANALGFTRRMFRSRAVPYLLKHFRNDYLSDYSILEVLAELEPVLALRVLRQTRPKGIRRDEDETHANRRYLLAKAHEGLGRTIRAQKLRMND